MGTLNEVKMSIPEALKVFDEHKKLIKQLDPNSDVEFAGSLLRNLEDKEYEVNDLDLVVINDEGELSSTVKMYFCTNPNYTVKSFGTQKAIMTHISGIQVDLNAVTPKFKDAAMLTYTGDSVFNVSMRSLAKSKGWILNEYGLYTRDWTKCIAITQKGIFEALDLKYIEPSERNFKRKAFNGFEKI